MSGNENLPGSWTRVPLAELLSAIETGKSFNCDERPPQVDEVGVAKVSAVSWGEYLERESKTCLDADRVNPDLFIREGDFLFSRANTQELVGACVIARKTTLRIMLSDKILRFRLSNDAMKQWLLDFLRSVDGRSQIEELASGNQDSMRNIGQERIGQILVPLAPTAEQARIIDKLEELFFDLDAGVAELKAAQAKLVRYRQSLLKAAVEGALTAEWRATRAGAHPPPRAGEGWGGGAAPPSQPSPARGGRGQSDSGAQLLQRILSERRARWEAKQLAKFADQGKAPPKEWQKKYPEPVQPDTAGLPELPEGWIWASVDQLSPDDIANGRSVPTSALGAKVLRLTAIKSGRIDQTEFKIGAWSEAEAQQFSIVQGDLLIARGNGSLNLVGRAGIVGNVLDQIAYPDTMIRLRVVDSVVSASWINLVWESKFVRTHLEQRARTSAGIYKISQPDIVSAPIPVGPLEEQAEIIGLIERTFDHVDVLQKYLHASSRLSNAQRKNILRAAFSGQLVPQDPNDEPASALLARIRAGREQRAVGKAPRRRKESA